MTPSFSFIRLRHFCTLKRVSTAAVLALSLTGAAAGNFTISPPRIFMVPSDRAIPLTLTNNGSSETTIQADLYAWSQNPDGSDNLVLTEDMIVSPPVVKLVPGVRQVIRLARLVPVDPARQLIYRLIVQEVPEVGAQKDEKGMRIQVPFALSMSLPVFITPPKAQRDLQCELRKVDELNYGALCENVGTAYAQVRQFVLMRNDKELAKFEGATYVLPNKRRTLSVKAASAIAAGPAVAKIVFDDGKVIELPLQIP